MVSLLMHSVPMLEVGRADSRRLQLRQQHLPTFFPSSRTAISARLQKDWPGQVDSNADGSVVHCCHGTVRSDGPGQLYLHS